MSKRKYGSGSISTIYRLKKDGTKYKYCKVAYYDNGIQKQFTTKSRAEAEERLKEINKKPKKSKSISNFCEFVKVWYNEYKAPNLALSSAKRIKTDLDKYILPKWEKRRLGTITPLELQQWFNTFSYSNSRSKLKITINEIFKKAVALKLLRDNPMNNVVVKKFKSEKRKPFDFNQQNVMLGKLPNNYKALFYFLCCTGLRIGEFLALTVSDFNFANKTLSITKSFDHVHNITKQTKTNEIRNIVFTNTLINKTLELANLKNLADFIGIFAYHNIHKYFTKIIKTNNWSKLSTHSTRHTFASVCYFAQIQDKYTQKWLGHKEMSMTTDVYTDLMQGGTSIILDYIYELKKAFTNC